VEIERGASIRFRVDRPADVDAFMAGAGEYLAAHEAEHCLILGIATNLRFGVQPLTGRRFAVAPTRATVASRRRSDTTAQRVVSKVDDLEAVTPWPPLAGEALPASRDHDPAAHLPSLPAGAGRRASA
jgi:hypothetical protein